MLLASDKGIDIKPDDIEEKYRDIFPGIFLNSMEFVNELE